MKPLGFVIAAIGAGLVLLTLIELYNGKHSFAHAAATQRFVAGIGVGLLVIALGLKVAKR